MTVHDLARRLPDIPALRDHCRALAMLEAILSPSWESRCYAFAAHWSDTEEMASMSDGCGDEYSIVFSPDGAYVRGFAHESRMSPYAGDGPWPGVLDDVPEVFRPCVEEPAFTDEDGMPVVTACLWRQPSDTAWRTGTSIDFPDSPDDDPDGAAHLFPLLLDRTPDAYRAFAEDYYDLPLTPAAVHHVLSLHPLTPWSVTALNPYRDLPDLTPDITAIGYPTA